MRTTLSLDDDVLLAVRERARREHRTAGAVLSELARQALTQQREAATSADTDGFYGFRPLPHRGEAVSNALIDRLRESASLATQARCPRAGPRAAGPREQHRVSRILALLGEPGR